MADGLFGDMIPSSHSIIYSFSVKVNSKGGGFPLNDNGVCVLTGFREFAGVGRLRRLSYILWAKPLDPARSKLGSSGK